MALTCRYPLADPSPTLLVDLTNAEEAIPQRRCRRLDALNTAYAHLASLQAGDRAAAVMGTLDLNGHEPWHSDP